MDIMYCTITAIWMLITHVNAFYINRLNYPRVYNIHDVPSANDGRKELPSTNGFPRRSVAYNTDTWDRTQHNTLDTRLYSLLDQYLGSIPSTPELTSEALLESLLQEYDSRSKHVYLTSFQQDAQLRPRKRKHRKRSAFDSISHNSGLNGFEVHGQIRKKKLPFTFENLLPYLLEMRRNGERR